MMFCAANRNHRFASAGTDASSACFSGNIVIIMGTMVMVSIFVVSLISLLGIIRLPLLVFAIPIYAVFGMNSR